NQRQRPISGISIAARETHGKASQALVGARYAHERRARSRARRVHATQPARRRALAEALGGAKPPPQERAIPLGDVDAELPHQPRRQGPFALAARSAGTRERGAQETLRKETPCPKNAPSNAHEKRRAPERRPARKPVNSSARRF